MSMPREMYNSMPRGPLTARSLVLMHQILLLRAALRTPLLFIDVPSSERRSKQEDVTVANLRYPRQHERGRALVRVLLHVTHIALLNMRSAPHTAGGAPLGGNCGSEPARFP